MKKIIEFFILIIIIFGFTIKINAQDKSLCGALEYYKTDGTNCENMLQQPNCIRIDITNAEDSLQKELIYEWDMGDGTLKRGLVIDHCYESVGFYTARLTLIDEANEVLIKDEYIVEIKIREPVELQISGPKLSSPYTSNTFVPNIHITDNYKVLESYWDLGDGTYECGDQAHHVFENPGIYEVKLTLILEGQDEIFQICASSTITIEDYNLYGGRLLKVFVEKENQQPIQIKFLQSPGLFLIIEKEKKEKLVFCNISEKQDHKIFLQPGKEYEMFAWKGNLISPLIKISTKESKDTSETFSIVKDAIERLMQSELVALKHIYFDFEGLKLEKQAMKDLKFNMNLLKGYPLISIIVGTHTHTGGPFDKNIALSKRRSDYIKELFVKNGFEEQRVFIAHPLVDRSLLNTCENTTNCGYEDARLNKRSELKLDLIN